MTDITGTRDPRARRAPSADIQPARLGQGGRLPDPPPGPPLRNEAGKAEGAGKAGPLTGSVCVPDDCTDPTFLGIHIQKPMETEREKELDKQIREELADDPEALAEYERLLETDLFRKSDYAWGKPICGPGENGQARVAILEQVLNYPEAEVIESLGRLGGRDWYRDMSFDDQQRTAKLIGVNESSTTPGGNQTRENTVEYILTQDNFKIDWRDERAGLNGSADSNSSPRVLMLNENMLDAGPGPVDLSDRDARHVTLNTSAHEVNHLIGGDQVEESYDYFMDEYRAWYVGYTSENGHPPTRQEAFDRASYLLTGYDDIRKGYQNNPAEQARIVRFMAELAGMDDPGSVTKDQLDAAMNSPMPLPDGSVPASTPVVTPDDDHNDLTNGG